MAIDRLTGFIDCSSADVSYARQLQVGCLLCEQSFVVDCANGAEQSLYDLADGEVPVGLAGRRQAKNENCSGLNAMNGICKPSEAMDALREMITAGEVDGATVVEQGGL